MADPAASRVMSEMVTATGAVEERVVGSGVGMAEAAVAAVDWATEAAMVEGALGTMVIRAVRAMVAVVATVVAVHMAL